MTRIASILVGLMLLSSGCVFAFQISTSVPAASTRLLVATPRLAATGKYHHDDGTVAPPTLSTINKSRRKVMIESAAVAAALASWWNGALSAANAAPSVEYKAVASDIADLIRQDPDKGPTFVRLAWHSSGTYDKTDNTGGSRAGSIRFAVELAHGGNAGLAKTAVAWLESVFDKYADQGLSHADLYTLAGVVAIREMGGPTIGWRSGRIDAPDDSVVTLDGRLPNADSGPPLADPTDASHIRKVFNRMGFNDQEIVALSGAHALGRCHETASGYTGPWTPTPTTFNNSYYTLLTSLKWVPKDWTGPPQYVDGATGRLMMLPTDVVLLQDENFKKWVDVYAKNPQSFYRDFSASFQKLEELGTTNLKATEWA